MDCSNGKSGRPCDLLRTLLRSTDWLHRASWRKAERNCRSGGGFGCNRHSTEKEWLGQARLFSVICFLPIRGCRIRDQVPTRQIEGDSMKHIFQSVVIATCLTIPGFGFAQDLPQAVIDLDLTDIEIREKPHAEYGRRVRGTLPGGSLVEVDLTGDDMIEDIEARGSDLFPLTSIGGLVPPAVTDHETWPADARLEKIEFESDGRIEIEGRLADGRMFDAEYAADGRMVEFDTDD